MRTEQAVPPIARCCHNLASREEQFRALDASAGDGDLGITVRLLSEAILAELAAGPPVLWRELLERLSKAVRTEAPSTFGSLVAIGLRAAGRSFGEADEEAGADEAASALEAGIAEIRRRGGAEPGEKTFIDALIPALDALREASDDSVALPAMAAAAAAGVEATKDEAPRHGRAAWVGERARGLPDAGSIVVVRALESLAGPPTFGDTPLEI
ncbi:MAG: Dak phosphatase [Acidimicrobiaceae bacterium]|nr:Dak phosphatase [Acidimicrobiaceae bacterium]